MKELKYAPNFAVVKGFDQETGVLSAVASNASIDRDGESIEPKAYANLLSNYQANPVILASHIHRTYEGMPSIIGSAQRIAVQDGELVFEMTFAATQIAREWKSLYADGHAKAFSVGFIPIAGENRKVDGKEVYTHTEVELLEISAVAVPSNREALSRGVAPELQERMDKFIADITKENKAFRDQLIEAQAKTMTELLELIEGLVGEGSTYKGLFDQQESHDDDGVVSDEDISIMKGISNG